MATKPGTTTQIEKEEWRTVGRKIEKLDGTLTHAHLNLFDTGVAGILGGIYAVIVLQ